MELRLIVRILAVVALVGGSLVAMADQSNRLVGVHEIPPFVTQRIELPAGPAAAKPLPDGLTPPAKPAGAI